MKKCDHKHIQIVAVDGFAPAELKKLQITLEHALGEAGTLATIDVRCRSGKQGTRNPVEGDGIEVETMREERDGDVFEEALRCVEAR